MKQKRTKSVHTNFNWLNDRTVNHKQLNPEWAPGPTNLGEYPTKHHTITHQDSLLSLSINFGQLFGSWTS